MARLVSVTVKERKDVVYTTSLVAAIAGQNIQYVQDKSGDAEIQLVNLDSAQIDKLLVDETFAAITTAINAANVTNGLNVVDVNVDKIDDDDFTAAPLDRLMLVNNIIFAERDPDNLATKVRVEYLNPQSAIKEVWIITVAIAAFITACNA